MEQQLQSHLCSPALTSTRTSPNVSPACSLDSIPGNPGWVSLFQESSDTVNPMDMMTPDFSGSDSPAVSSSPAPEATPCPPAAVATTQTQTTEEADTTTGTETQPTKKRKTWGQKLPKPKTNLPPRKRAKTADEKEQRRVERVLRNRRAAQSSRERKRLEVENLEKRKQQLEAQVIAYDEAMASLISEVKRIAEVSGVAPNYSIIEAAVQSTRAEQFSPEESQDQTPAPTTAPPADSSSTQAPATNSTPTTVNPATISPQLTPIIEEAEPLSNITTPQAPPVNLPLGQVANNFEHATNASPVLAHPAVSSIGGGVTAVPSVANSDPARLGLAAATLHDAVFVFGDSCGQLPSVADASQHAPENMQIDNDDLMNQFINDDWITDFTTDFPLYGDSCQDESSSFFDNAAASADSAASIAVDLVFTSHLEN